MHLLSPNFTKLMQSGDTSMIENLNELFDSKPGS